MASEKTLSDLTLAIVPINAWNRLNIAMRTVPGAYQPAKALRDGKTTVSQSCRLFPRDS